MAIKREIKFRSWDTETKEMSYDFLIKNWLLVCVESPYVELMQFTGRKDKNGIEIYEDDIVIDSEGRYGLVYWNLNDCQFLVDFQADMEIEETSSYHTVCGNSWQNVELLKYF